MNKGVKTSIIFIRLKIFIEKINNRMRNPFNVSIQFIENITDNILWIVCYYINLLLLYHSDMDNYKDIDIELLSTRIYRDVCNNPFSLSIILLLNDDEIKRLLSQNNYYNKLSLESKEKMITEQKKDMKNYIIKIIEISFLNNGLLTKFNQIINYAEQMLDSYDRRS